MDRRFRRPSTPWMALVLAALVLAETGNLFLVGDAAIRADVSNVLQSLAALLGTGIMIAAARRLRLEKSDAAPGWLLIGAAAILFLAGAFAFWVSDLVWPAQPYPDISDAFFLASYPAIMLGLARLPRDRLSVRERWNAALDFALLSVVTGVAVWELSLRDLLFSLLAKTDAASFVSLAYTLLNLALLLVLFFRLVVNLGQGRMFVPNLLLVAGGLCLTTADLAMGRVAASAVFTSGTLIDLGWLLFAALGGLAGLYVLERGDDAGIVHGSGLRASWSTALIYACFGGGGALLIWELGHRAVINIPLLASAAAATVVLAGIRQMRTVRQAARLSDRLEQARADLETKVRERTAELEAASTSLRASEEQYRALNVTLERRVAERTAQLEEANRELESFSYSVSHDLRAPLRAIDGYARAIEEDHGADLAPGAREHLDAVRAGARHLGELVDGILALSHLGGRALQRSTVDPAELVRGALDDVRRDASGALPEVVVAPLPSCHADPLLLRQVFTNLLANAFKFTSRTAGAAIEVGCRGDGAGAVYYVKDNGAGFDATQARKLFSPFQRLHSAAEYPGTGVGLAIVHSIVRKHGGRVWAEAAPGQGATFCFTLGATADG